MKDSDTIGYILLVDCDDEKGIVHKVTGILFEHGLNIEEQAEFVDKATNHFFMRTGVSGVFRQELLIADLQACSFNNLQLKLTPVGSKNIVVMVSKEPHCLGDLLIRHEYGELQGRILAVVGNHAKLSGLTEKFGIPFHFIPHENKTREEHELQLVQAINQYNPDYLVLAKYMRILSPSFVQRYPNRIINIHHSFLPAFSGARPYHQAFERGVKIIGATAHFVTEELDEGPIIAQNVIPTAHNKSPADMVRAGRDVEKAVLAKALRLALEDRLFVHQRHTIIFD